MTSVGPGNIAAYNLVGSFAGAQRASGDGDRTQAEGAAQKFQADLKVLASQSLDDVAGADQSADRDADGRLPYGHPDHPAPDGDDSDDTAVLVSMSRRGTDPFGERGNALDLDA